MNECSLNTIACKLTEHRNNQWKELLTSKPKLRTYMKFKVYNFFIKPKCRTYIKFKVYIYTQTSMLNIVPLRKRRSLLAQFRLGILPLHIETARFRNMKSEEQLCFICHINVIEDEQRFVFVCNEYSLLRK